MVPAYPVGRHPAGVRRGEPGHGAPPGVSDGRRPEQRVPGVRRPHRRPGGEGGQTGRESPAPPRRR